MVRAALLVTFVLPFTAAGCTSAPIGMTATQAAAIRYGVGASLQKMSRYQAAEQWDSLVSMSGIASVITGFETRLTSPAGPPISFGGMITMTLVSRDGSWRILVGHASAPGERDR